MSGTSSSTTITVHPQQPQSVDINSSGGNALDSSEVNSTVQSHHLTSNTLVQHVEVHCLFIQFNNLYMSKYVYIIHLIILNVLGFGINTNSFWF